MQKRQIAHNLLQHTWHLYSRSSSVPLGKRIVYWGAEQVPLTIYVQRRKNLLSKQSTLPFNVGFHFDSRPKLGPLIGILTASAKGGDFTGVRANFIAITRAAHEHGGIVFVFTPEQIDWKTREITGFVYHLPYKKWKKVRFPLPNVVYNRVPNRHLENETQVQQCIRDLQNVPGLTLFNPHFFNKQDLFSKLQSSATLSAHLPSTEHLQNQASFKHMLNQHQAVYLKPIHGKAGSGIMKVQITRASGKKKYDLYLPQGKKYRTKSISRFSTLWKWVQQYTRHTPYMMQKAVSLAKFNHSPFDFRALLQKDGSGTWQMTGLGVRVAGQRSITTHVPRGGHIQEPGKVLQQLFPDGDTHQRVRYSINRLTLAIAEELENHYHHLGEMSMDIGLDTNGDLWFFEANAKPMKFDEPDIRKKSLQNIIDYARYVTFDQPREGTNRHGMVNVY